MIYQVRSNPLVPDTIPYCCGEQIAEQIKRKKNILLTTMVRTSVDVSVAYTRNSCCLREEVGKREGWHTIGGERRKGRKRGNTRNVSVCKEREFGDHSNSITDLYWTSIDVWNNGFPQQFGDMQEVLCIFFSLRVLIFTADALGIDLQSIHQSAGPFVEQMQTEEVKKLSLSKVIWPWWGRISQFWQSTWSSVPKPHWLTSTVAMWAWIGTDYSSYQSCVILILLHFKTVNKFNAQQMQYDIIVVKEIQHIWRKDWS